jgi:peptide chain release factor subunit 1
MAGTVTWSLLRELAGFRAEKGCAISLYLNLDPSDVPTAGDAQTRMNSMLNAADRTDRTDLTHEQRMGLKADFERIAQWFDDDFERDGSQGLAVFAAGLDNSWRTLALPAPVDDRAKVGRDFFLAPLAPLIGRADGTIVAVVSREEGQLYRLRGGRLEEIAEHYDETPGQHDQGGWSQARYQRHIEKLVHDHLKDVAETLDRQVREQGGPPLVVVASEETRAELEETLSHEVKKAIVGWTSADAHAGPAELLEDVQPLLESRHGQQETEVVERWKEEAGRNARAAAGWGPTLEAASDGRVELLLFQNGTDRPAWECPACGRVASEGGACPLDGTQMEERKDGLDLAVHQTLAHGGTVLSLSQRQDLEPVEGIGALLRF